MATALVALVALAALGASAGCGSDDSSGGPVALKFYVAPEGSGSFENASETCTKQADGRYRVTIAPLPADAGAQREQLVRRLAAKDDDIDIIGMDVIWTAEFAEAGWVKPWTGELEREVRRGTLPATLETATYQDKLWAAPGNTNAQLLWYRKDRVKTPPKTWDEMFQMARKLGKDGLIEAQGGQKEALAVWFNTLVNSAGGSVLKGQDEPGLGAPAEKAAAIIGRLANGPWTDPSLSNQREDENRLAWESGAPSFMVNYSFVYPSAKENAPEVFKNMAWAPYPSVEAGKPAKVSIGGFNLGVGAYSKHPKESFEAAACMRSAENQRFAADKGGLPPTLQSLYDSPAFAKANPFSKVLLQTIKDSSVRPVSPVYNDISLAIQKTLSPPGSVKDPAATAEKLKQRVADALVSKGLL